MLMTNHSEKLDENINSVMDEYSCILKIKTDLLEYVKQKSEHLKWMNMTCYCCES